MSSDERDARLLLELAGDTRAPIELPRSGVLSIGADRERADFVVEGQGVSPVHCAIGRVKGGGWALKDLGSEYGVLVNGERVATRKLEVGDLIVLGSRRMRVVDPDAPPPSAPVAVAGDASNGAKMPAAATSVEAPPGKGRSGSGAVAESSLPQFKGYRVEGPLGRGGMGEVYLAVQESLGRPVALKVLSSKLAADADFVLRFQSEARAAAALNHPNVVTVHDVWEEQGRHLLAMEYMDRGNLESRLARGGKLTSKEALEVLSDASKALVYAELRGIVHRDIKPANLMQNSVGTTKLADLGLAMHLEAEATEADNKKIFGTPHFISPEQARGEKVDIRSDMYSLGATMYRLLSGRTPFEGATTRDILRGHFLDEPKPLGELEPDLRPELVAIVQRLLRKKPDDRYPSASLLLQEVERVKSITLHGAHPIASSSGSKSGVLIGVGVAVAALAGAAFWMLRGDESPPKDAPVVRRGPNDGPATTTTTAPGAGGPATTVVDDVPPPIVAPPTRPSDDDTALKLRETEADNAYLRLPRDLTPKERRDELRALVERFAGTTASGKFRLEADDLTAQIEREGAAASQLTTAIDSWIERARASIVEGEQRKPLAAALRALLALESSPELIGDTAFGARRRALFSETIQAAIANCRAALARADEHERTGDFDGVGAELRPWLGALDLPSMPPDLGFDALPELGDLIGLRGLIQKRVDGLEGAKKRFLDARAKGDASAIAAALRGPNGLEDAYARLDFDAIDRQLASLEATLGTDESRQWIAQYREGAQRGRETLVRLAAEFDSGGWRRKSVSDPRVRGRATRDALSASPEGLMLKSDVGGDMTPWSAFGAHTSDLHQLFHQRLSREYTVEELRGIETLMRTSAVVQTVQEVADLFSTSASGVLSDDETRSILEAFELASVWAAGGANPRAVEHETQAAKTLIDALRATNNGAWSRATTAFEALFDSYADTLLVRLLSDGRGVASVNAQSR